MSHDNKELKGQKEASLSPLGIQGIQGLDSSDPVELCKKLGDHKQKPSGY